MKKLFFVLLISLNSCNENQELNIVVNNLFQDNMIIQHNSETPIWGTVKPNKQVKIEMSWGDKYKTLADSKGNWRINIKTPIADNIPHSIRVESSDDEIIFNNILLGEVWLASGQSNMQWRMRRSENKNELSNSVFNNKKIRMITVDRNLSLKPLSKFSGEWKICSTETISDFSAVGYFFAKKLYDELDVPIGIINSSVGGTPAESWSNINNLEKVNGFENLRERLEISNDTNSVYNLWLSTHKYVNRDEFINKKEIKFFDKKNKLFLDEEFNDTKWKVRSLDEIRTIFKKKEVDLSKYSRFQNSHDDFDGAVWLRNDFVINQENILNIELEIGELATTQEFYSVFINGELIGRKNNWSSAPSRYKIRDGLLKLGKNNISIRLLDFYGDGGLKEDLNRGLYSQNEKIISFDDSWKTKFIAWLTNENLYLLNDGFSEVVFPSPIRISRSQGSYTVLNNSMINPLGNFKIKGVIWYQGEGNRSRSRAYTKVFPALIDSFREQWNDNTLPFYYVQLAPFGDIAARRRSDSEFVAELREAQRLTLKKNNVGMAVIMDVGDDLDIHPLPKKPVGDRLALLALAKDYGFENLVYSGPLFKQVKYNNNEAVITFENIGSGLFSPQPQLNHFEVASENKKFYGASARIVGNSVIASSKKVTKPIYVRYGWKNFLIPSLFNKEGLPASSFSSLENPFTQ
jgi:sialate O-acetylesterase